MFAGGGGGGGGGSPTGAPGSPAIRVAAGKGVMLRRAAEETMGEIEGLHGGMQTLHTAIQTHAATLGQYKQQLRRAEDDLRGAQQEAKLQRAEAEAARAAAKSADDALKQGEADRRKAMAHASSVEETSALKDLRLTDLQARLEGLERELLLANQRVSTGNAEVSDLRRRALAADAAANASQAKANSQASQLQGLQQELQDAAARAAGLERRAAEGAHALTEAHAQLKRMEYANDQLQQKVGRCEATINDLRRDQAEATKMKVALEEATRQIHSVMASKQRSDVELARSEEAHAQALGDLTVLERLKGEFDALKRAHDATLQTLSAAEEHRDRFQREAAGVGEALAQAEKRAAAFEAEAAVFQEQLAVEAHKATVLETTLGLREQDAGELAALREEVMLYKREREELAAGVERLHAQVDAERRRRVELEAFQNELISQRAQTTTARELQSTEERSLLERQLAQIATTLDMLWKEFSPYILPGRVAPGEPPLDGQLAELAYRGTRLLKGAQEVGGRLRAVTMKYLGVLGERARKTAEAAMLADATHDTDDFDASLEVLTMILDKLLADITNARHVIEDQNRTFSQSRASHSYSRSPYTVHAAGAGLPGP